MVKMSKIVLVLAVAAFALTGCSSTTPADDISVQSAKDAAGKIVIVASSKEVMAGDSVNLKAEVFDAAGNKITASPSWKIVNAADRTGSLNRTTGENVVFMAVRSGKAVVESEFSGMKSSVEITVLRRPAAVRMQAK